jgi:hypothetical protein
MTTLASVVSDISQKKKTGMLSMMVKAVNQLLKIYFIDGEIHHMLYADQKDSACLDCLDTLEISDCFFLADVKSNLHGRISMPTSEIIERLTASNKSVVCKDMGEGAVPAGLQDFSAIRDRLKAALIRQIGPVGDIVFPKAVEKWTAASPPTKQGLSELVNLLKEEIDDPTSKAEFITEANQIIS